MRSLYPFAKIGFCILLGLLCAGCTPDPVQQPVGEAERVVRALSEAFNAHDVDAMAAHVADDIMWLGIGTADSLYVEAAGKEALVAGMTGYFEAIPTVRSVMEAVVVTGDFVAFRERVFWENENGEQTQAALAVYEVRNGQIQRVWYYPTTS